MVFPSDPDMLAYYGRGEERSRLESPKGQLEFVRTKEILSRHLPVAPATIADVGGGAGAYSMWLAKEGYRVLLRDLVPLHIDQAVEAAEAGLECIDLVTVEGLGFAFSDLAERWADPIDREAVLDAARRIEGAEELLGLGPHLLLTARK